MSGTAQIVADDCLVKGGLQVDRQHDGLVDELIEKISKLVSARGPHNSLSIFADHDDREMMNQFQSEKLSERDVTGKERRDRVRVENHRHSARSIFSKSVAATWSTAFTSSACARPKTVRHPDRPATSERTCVSMARITKSRRVSPRPAAIASTDRKTSSGMSIVVFISQCYVNRCFFTFPAAVRGISLNVHESPGSYVFS